MAQTKEEERKLKDYKDNSPVKLGPAEKFLKTLLDVPLAFKRVGAMLYMSNFESEVEYLRSSFETLEGACEELRNSRMFLKLLEACSRQLVDVEGADEKTTLLHFVVQEIIRTEGARHSGMNQSSNSTANDEAKCQRVGLQVVSGLTTELVNVKKAAAMDSDILSSDVNKLSKGIGNIRDVARLVESMGSDENTSKFSGNMNQVLPRDSAKEEAHPFRIFMVVRDFLAVLDRVCKEVGSVNDQTIVTSAHRLPIPVNPMLPVPVNPTLPQAFLPFHRQQRDNSSDDESSTP
ncbi:hypothetical protein MLD38_031666 [Melastoma candidum]|uniref:Uncharacterized protein n=1 Tax=Melastoma candidum TaxID=119954 RepID=A0ACB9MRV8_9MYRT|nr:hypothetical protein MLD38_031666 [Melastoma candidum]